MERTLCKEIVLESYAVGTMDIMDYADEHPNEYFDFTHVYSKHTLYGMLTVSDFYADEDMVRYYDRIGWRDLPNGWQRTSTNTMFVCRKNGRYIYITS